MGIGLKLVHGKLTVIEGLRNPPGNILRSPVKSPHRPNGKRQNGIHTEGNHGCLSGIDPAQLGYKEQYGAGPPSRVGRQTKND